MNAATMLLVWLLGAFSTWEPSQGKDNAFRDGMARDILAVAFDPNEPPLPPFKGRDGRIRTAALMASFARHESSLRPDVDAGHCRENECDHGTAFCVMQVRPGAGIILKGDEYDYAVHQTRAWRTAHDAEIIDGARLLDDRRLCFRVALHMLRGSLRHSGTLGEYTGETGNGPAAKKRWNDAAHYFTASAPGLEDGPVLASMPELLQVHDVVRSPR